MRTAYQYKHLSPKAQAVAQELMKGTLLTQWLYNEDGTQFETTTVQL